MSNTNRDYIVICDVKNSKLTVYRPIKFYITDKNTSNIFIRLVTKIENDSGVVEYVDVEPATNYVVTMRIIKPDDEVKSVIASKLEEGAVYQVDLQDDCKDIPGTYKCELLISTTVYGRQELNTSDMFTYNVVNSILSKAVVTETKGITTEYILNQVDAYNSQATAIGLQLNDIGLQIQEVEDATKKTTNPITEKFPVITFIDDDCKANFFNIWKPICDSKGLKITLACVPDWIEKQSNEVMTLGQLKSLYKEGFDIISHTWSHDARIFKASASDLSKITDEEIRQEYRKAKEWLKNNGFGNVDNLAYPWGNFGGETLRYKRIARHYYKNAVNASGSVNACPNDNIYLDRVFVNTSNDIATYKIAVDNLVGTNNWLILGTHSNDSEINQAYLTELIEYIQSKNIPILTMKDALKYKENALSVGEFTDTNNRLYVSKMGDVLLGKNTNVYKTLTPAVNSKWSRDLTRERIVKKGFSDELECHICLTNVNKTGSYAQDEVMFTISEFTSSSSKSYIYLGTIVTGDAQVLPCYFWVKVDSTGTEVRMLNVSSVSNIRWLFMNFTISK